jgi:hypothetical protein
VEGLMFESKIIKFYENRARDNYGRKLEEMQKYSYEQLENIHNYIQWMFPLREKSSMNLSAPIIKDKDIAYIKDSSLIKGNMLISTLLISDFWGIGKEFTGNEYFVKSNRIKLWVTPMNHNFLRVTRVLKSLVLFDMKDEADILFKCFEEIRNNGNHHIIRGSFTYWKEAVQT